MPAGPFADENLNRVRTRFFHKRWIDQLIVNDHRSMAQQLQAANRDQPRISGARANEIDFAVAHNETPNSLSKWLFARATSPRIKNCLTSPLNALRQVSNGALNERFRNSILASAARPASCSYSCVK